MLFHLQYVDASGDEDLVSNVRRLSTEEAVATALSDRVAARVRHGVIPANGSVPDERVVFEP